MKFQEQLYQLLTDQGFLHENMVWETLNDVDATFSEFVNGNFETIPPVPEPSPSSSEAQNMTLQQQINSEYVYSTFYLYYLIDVALHHCIALCLLWIMVMKFTLTSPFQGGPPHHKWHI